MSSQASHTGIGAQRATRAIGDPRPAFLRSKLASILAVVPLGAWTVGHVWNNLAAYDSGPAWERAVTSYPHPIAQLATAVLVFAPLLLHTIWGLGRILISRPNNLRYGFYTNLKYVLQRVSAIGVMLFLGAHVWLASIKPRLIEGRPEPFVEIAHEMRHHGPTLVVYLLGTLGVAYHLANGLSTVAFSIGLYTTERARKRLEGFVLAFFFVLLAMSWGVIYALYREGA